MRWGVQFFFYLGYRQLNCIVRSGKRTEHVWSLMSTIHLLLLVVILCACFPFYLFPGYLGIFVFSWSVLVVSCFILKVYAPSLCVIRSVLLPLVFPLACSPLMCLTCLVYPHIFKSACFSFVKTLKIQNTQFVIIWLYFLIF